MKEETCDRDVYFSIFESTQVALNLEFLTFMPASIDISTFFLEIAEEMDLTFCEQVENGCPVFIGMWSNVIKAEKKLEAMLSSWQEQSNELELAPTDRDPSVECEPMKPSSTPVDLMTFEDEMKHCPELISNSDHSLYIVTDNVNELVQCTTLSDMKSALNNIQGNVETSQIPSNKNNEDCAEVKEIYVDIALSNKKKRCVRAKLMNAKCEASSNPEQNPLDKLCQLLCIAEDEIVEKRVTTSEEKKRREESLPFRFFCDLCSFKTKRENHFIKHAKLHEKIKTVLCCDQCDFKAIRDGALRRHMMTHSDTQFQCKFCSYKTDSTDLLIKHVQTRHGSSIQKKTKCNFCDFNAPTPKELQTHLRLFHENERSIKIWKCSKCDYKSRLRAHLKRHENDKHSSVRQFLCDYCGKSFKRNDTLTQHKVVHGEVNKTYNCLQCGKVCTSAVFLRDHLASHTTERPFLCDVCGRSFKTQTATLRHKRAQHSTSSQVFPCPQCSLEFMNKADLNRHKKTHRLKTETVVADIVSAAASQEQIPQAPISIQVLYTDRLNSTAENMIA